jgi:hypothetical protein
MSFISKYFLTFKVRHGSVFHWLQRFLSLLTSCLFLYQHRTVQNRTVRGRFLFSCFSSVAPSMHLHTASRAFAIGLLAFENIVLLSRCPSSVSCLVVACIPKFVYNQSMVSPPLLISLPFSIVLSLSLRPLTRTILLLFCCFSVLISHLTFDFFVNPLLVLIIST